MTKEKLKESSLGGLRISRKSLLKNQRNFQAISTVACCALFPLSWHMIFFLSNHLPVESETNSTYSNVTNNGTAQDVHQELSLAALAGIMVFGYCCVSSPIYSLFLLCSSYRKIKEKPDVSFSKSQTDILNFIQQAILNEDLEQIENQIVESLINTDFTINYMVIDDEADYSKYVKLETGVIKLKIIELCRENEGAKAYFHSVAERLKTPVVELFNAGNLKKMLAVDDEELKQDIRSSELPREVIGLLEGVLGEGEYIKLADEGREHIFKELMFILEEVDKTVDKTKESEEGVKSRSDSFDVEAQLTTSEMERVEFTPFFQKEKVKKG